jgi:serine protease Do
LTVIGEPPLSGVVAGVLAGVAAELRCITVQVATPKGAGSGTLWGDGVIVTSAHVAPAAEVEVVLHDGRVFPARLRARDPGRDLAAFAIAVDGLPAAVVGDSDAIRVGDLVLAVGNPLGVVGALSAGVIHAVTRYQPGSRSWLQANLRLAPGNSGGPLADARGHVIGITAMIAGGLALAVPSNEVRRFLREAAARPA